MEPAIGFLEEEELIEDYDESKLPCSGLEYLRRVQQEAMECPDVVVADISQKKSSKQTVEINSNVMPVPTCSTPSYKWQIEQAADFADLRQKMAHFKAKGTVKSQLNEKSLPNKNDEKQWYLFCFGKHERINSNENNPDSKTADFNSETSLKQQEGTPPLSSILFRMNQVTIQQVLEYHVNWLEKEKYSHIQGRWLYSLLACLEKPLLPETIALLRTLARQCARYRMNEVQNSPDNDHLMLSLNLIIALVARYFGQSDLADPG